MKPKHLLLVLLLLIALTACDNSLRKATQQVLNKENPSTPTTAKQEAEQKESNPTTPSNCPQPDPHPLGESIAEKFKVSYDEVIDWYCEGYLFEDILLAAQTSQLADVEPGELLQDTQSKSWDQIWEELDLVKPQN